MTKSSGGKWIAQKNAVALALLESLEGEDESTVARAWAYEIRQRKSELRSGTVRAVPWDEAKARLNSL